MSLGFVAKMRIPYVDTDGVYAAIVKNIQCHRIASELAGPNDGSIGIWQSPDASVSVFSDAVLFRILCMVTVMANTASAREETLKLVLGQHYNALQSSIHYSNSTQSVAKHV